MLFSDSLKNPSSAKVYHMRYNSQKELYRYSLMRLCPDNLLHFLETRQCTFWACIDWWWRLQYKKSQEFHLQELSTQILIIAGREQKILRLFSLLLVTLQAFELGGMRCLSGIHLSCVMASQADCSVCNTNVVGISRHLRIFFTRNAEKKTYDCKDIKDKDCRVFHIFILPYL